MKLIEYSYRDMNTTSCMKAMHDTGIIDLAQEKLVDIQSNDFGFYSRITQINSLPPGSWRPPDRGRILDAHPALLESVTPRTVKPDREIPITTFKEFNP